MQKRSRKDFTLAELLIVVAIIAILTAIAVPLFVSSVTKAQNATKEANKRAVRGAAVVAILSAETPAYSESTDKDKDDGAVNGNGIHTLNKAGKSWELKGPWVVTATLDKSGNITGDLSINATTGATEAANGAYNEGKDSITVTVVVTILQLPGSSN